MEKKSRHITCQVQRALEKISESVINAFLLGDLNYLFILTGKILTRTRLPDLIEVGDRCGDHY